MIWKPNPRQATVGRVSDRISEKVLGRIASILGIDETRLSLDESLDAMSEWDSMATLQVIVALEDDFGIRFSDAEARNGWANVQAIVD